MVCGKNKIILINVLIALLGCGSVILTFHFGYEWYMSDFHPHSRGALLGFVMFYMRGVIIPTVFISAFLKAKYSLLMISAVNVYMFYSWYGTNPLRVILMFLSGITGFAIVLIFMTLRDKYMKELRAKENTCSRFEAQSDR